jgi:hypothetical protein
MIKTPRLHSAIVSYFGGLITGIGNFNLSNRIMDAARSGDYDKAHDLTLRHNILDKNNTYRKYDKFPINLFKQNIQEKMRTEHPEKVTKAMATTHPAIKTIGLGGNALRAIASGNWDKVDSASMTKIHRALMEHGFGKNPLDISHIESYAKTAKSYSVISMLQRELQKASQHDRDPERQRKLDMDTSFFRKPKTYRGVHPDHDAILRYFDHFSRVLPRDSRATIMHDASLGEYGSAQRKLARRNDRLPAGLDGLKFGDYQIDAVKTMDEKGIFKSFQKSIKKNELLKALGDDYDDEDDRTVTFDPMESPEVQQKIQEQINNSERIMGVHPSETLIRQITKGVVDEWTSKYLDRAHQIRVDSENEDGPQNLDEEEEDEISGALGSMGINLSGGFSIDKKAPAERPSKAAGSKAAERPSKPTGSKAGLAKDRWESPYHNLSGEFVTNNGETPAGPLFNANGKDHPEDYEITRAGRDLLNSIFPNRTDSKANLDPNRNLAFFTGMKKDRSGKIITSAMSRRLKSWKIHIEKMLKRELTPEEMEFINHHAYRAKAAAEFNGYKASFPEAGYEQQLTEAMDKLKGVDNGVFTLPDTIRQIFINVRKNPKLLSTGFRRAYQFLDNMTARAGNDKKKLEEIAKFKATVREAEQMVPKSTPKEKFVIGDEAAWDRADWMQASDRAKERFADKLLRIQQEYFPRSSERSTEKATFAQAFAQTMKEEGLGKEQFDNMTSTEASEKLMKIIESFQKQLKAQDSLKPDPRAEAAVKLGYPHAEEIRDINMMKRKAEVEGNAELMQEANRRLAQIPREDYEKWDEFMGRTVKEDRAALLEKYKEEYGEDPGKYVDASRNGFVFRFERHPASREMIDRAFGKIEKTIETLPQNITEKLRAAIANRDTGKVDDAFLSASAEIKKLYDSGKIDDNQEQQYQKVLREAETHRQQARGFIPERQLKRDQVPDGARLYEGGSPEDFDRATHITPFHAMLAADSSKRGEASVSNEQMGAIRQKASEEFEAEYSTRLSELERQLMQAQTDEDGKKIQENIDTLKREKDVAKTNYLSSVEGKYSLLGGTKSASEMDAQRRRRRAENLYANSIRGAWSNISSKVLSGNFASEFDDDSGKELFERVTNLAKLGMGGNTNAQSQKELLKQLKEILAERDPSGRPIIRNNNMLETIYNVARTLDETLDRIQKFSNKEEINGSKKLSDAPPLAQVAFGGVPISKRGFVQWATNKGTNDEVAPIDDPNSAYNEVIRTITHKQVTDENGVTHSVPRFTPDELAQRAREQLERKRRGDPIGQDEHAESELALWIAAYQDERKRREKQRAKLQEFRDNPEALQQNWLENKDMAIAEIKAADISKDQKTALIDELSTPEGWLARQERSVRKADTQQLGRIWDVISQHPMANLLKGKIATQMQFRSQQDARGALYRNDRSGLSDPELQGRVGDPQNPSGFPVAMTPIVDQNGKPTGRYTYEEFAPDQGKDPLLYLAHEQFHRNRAAESMTRNRFWPAMKIAFGESAPVKKMFSEAVGKKGSWVSWLQQFVNPNGNGNLDPESVRKFLRYQAEKTGKYVSRNGTFNEDEFNNEFNKISGNKAQLTQAFSQALYDASIESHRTKGAGTGEYDVPALPESFVNKIHDMYHRKQSVAAGGQDVVGQYMEQRTKTAQERAQERSDEYWDEVDRRRKGQKGGMAKVDVKGLPLDEAAKKVLDDKLFSGTREGAERSGRDLASGHSMGAASRRLDFNGHLLNKVGEDGRLVPEEGETQTHGGTPWSDRELLLAHALHSLRHLYPEYHHLENKTKDENGEQIFDAQGRPVYATSGGAASEVHTKLSRYLQGAATGNYDMMHDAAKQLHRSGLTFEGLQRPDLIEEHNIPGKEVTVGHLFKPIASFVAAKNALAKRDRTKKKTDLPNDEAPWKTWKSNALPQLRQAASAGTFDAFKPVVSNYFKTAERVQGERNAAKVDQTAPVVPPEAAATTVKAFAPTPFPFRIGAF